MTVGSGTLWTDALIEIGATVCVPRAPQCPQCPVKAECRAYRGGDAARLGLPARKPPLREVNVSCGIIRREDGRILIAQRPETGLLPGLWEFPGGKRQGNEKLADTCRREIKEELGVNVSVGERRLVIRHAYSHYHVRLHVFDCRFASGREPRALGCTRFVWVWPRGLLRYAFPAANRRIIEMLLS